MKTPIREFVQRARDLANNRDIFSGQYLYSRFLTRSETHRGVYQDRVFESKSKAFEVLGERVYCLRFECLYIEELNNAVADAQIRAIEKRVDKVRRYLTEEELKKVESIIAVTEQMKIAGIKDLFLLGEGRILSLSDFGGHYDVEGKGGNFVTLEKNLRLGVTLEEMMRHSAINQQLAQAWRLLPPTVRLVLEGVKDREIKVVSKFMDYSLISQIYSR